MREVLPCFLSMNPSGANLLNNFSLLSGKRNIGINAEVVVAMAVYDGDKRQWIEQSIASILQQSFKDFLFYIAIDGPIREDCLSYLQQIAETDSRIVLYQGKDNLGLSDCMNFIIDECKSVNPRYWVRMDADDISVKSRIQKQKAVLDESQDISVLGSSLSEINELGHVVGERKVPLDHESIVTLLPRRCPLNHPTVMVRYAVFNEGFRYISGRNITEDYFLWADLAARGLKFRNLESKLLHFRRVDAFYRRRGMKRSFSELQARFYTMRKLSKFSMTNVVHAYIVFILRIMPPFVVKLAYKLDRLLLEKIIKH